MAVLCDVHGNPPALQAVLDDVAKEEVDAVVVGGDVATGPMPRQTLELLAALSLLVKYLRGNADREAVAAFDQRRLNPERESDPVEQEAAFTAATLTHSQRNLLAGLPTTTTLDIDGLGSVVFCHGSPRSDTEILTTATSEERLATALAHVQAPTVVGGHTHRQFDRKVGGKRFINAGSVGRPYEGHADAFWARLGPGVALRRSDYDIEQALALLRPTGFPGLDGVLRDTLTEPIDPDEVASFFEDLAASN